MNQTQFETGGGVRVSRTATPFDPDLLTGITRQVEDCRGGVFSSGMEYPGRYSRWHMAYIDPCVELVARGRRLTATALNDRGRVLLPVIGAAMSRVGEMPDARAGLARRVKGEGEAGGGSGCGDEGKNREAVTGGLPAVEGRPEAGPSRRQGGSGGPAGGCASREGRPAGHEGGRGGGWGHGGPGDSAPRSGGPGVTARVSTVIPEAAGAFAEEERSRRPTVFSALREIIAAFAGPDPHLGLYGAFGYDLAFQFEPVRQRHARQPAQRDLVLHLPDRLYVLDRKRETATCYSYDFAVAGASTAGLARGGGRGGAAPDARGAGGPPGSVMDSDLPPDPRPGSYAAVVEQARERFARGDLFEVVPSHVFHGACDSPAAFYERLRRANPAPYEFFLNLGEGEYLVGASPEMYVRVTGERVETCPIAGTIARGADPLQDAENIAALLSSVKDESELTMCTDVDRNDKSRICEPGSVRVIGRRQIEIYSRLIHTVDHVEGRLRAGFDALDAFLTHMWAVTVTGAPKPWAMQFIEDHEDAPRCWYGGAVGWIGFDGGMNTGLTLRTAHIRGGVAAVRTGATLLFESDPAAEERETQLKARALLETLAGGETVPGAGGAGPLSGPRPAGPMPGAGMRVLLVDHQDSFVHTLGSYFREAGAEVTTLRAGFDPGRLDEYRPDLVVLSPGPGRPSDFSCDKLLTALDERGIAAFGVCLGLQAMVEHAGGRLRLLTSPAHGKPGSVRVLGDPAGSGLLAGLPPEFTAGRYHSLHAAPGDAGGGFTVTALTPDGVVMAIEDDAAGRWGVQFHPESILTASGGAGHQVIANVLRLARSRSRGQHVAGCG